MEAEQSMVFKIVTNLSLAFAIDFWCVFSYAEDYHFYINADFTYNVSSGESIHMGIETALSETSHSIHGKTIKLLKCDHKGINSRSEACIRSYLNDPKALIMYAGLHSPPLITNLKNHGSPTQLNESEILTLVPWAAAGSITRDGPPNWIYRLSIDDKYAGKFILKETLKEGFTKIGLLLVNDGWGKYNFKNITSEMQKQGVEATEVIMFERDLTEDVAKLHLRRLVQKPLDAIIMVSNAPQAITIFKGIKSLGFENKFAIRSHWGITGGNLWNEVGSIIKNTDLRVIQTKFSFHRPDLNIFQKNVFAQARRIFPQLYDYSNLKAPVGFIHGYDITRIAIESMRKSRLSGIPHKDKHIIKAQLEKMEVPVEGLIKTYSLPFQRFSKKQQDSHEALSVKDYRMFRYTADGNLIE